MKVFLIIVLVAMMAMVLVSLIRGIIAFLKTTKLDLESGDVENIREMQLKQNRMMMARIFYQFLAVLVALAILAAAS
ncbi:hypothetical protein [Altererythrobacter sp.]|uniref:hypothetical protein n=1 Tax=Altererythrobacter sp. TaxID=1872480 RepID=UPI003CFCD28D